MATASPENFKNLSPTNSLVSGYKIFCCKEHPLANSSGWGYLHRHKLSLKLGRWISSYEHVHHKDGNKLNNNLNNLELITISEHAAKHAIAKASKKIKKVCPRCNTIFYTLEKKNKKFCSSLCARENVKKVKDLISIHDLSKLVWEKPVSAIAKNLGISDSAIHKFIKKNHIEKPPANYFLKKDVQIFLFGKANKKIGKKMKKETKEMLRQQHQGQNGSNAKITNDDAIQILQDSKNGISNKTLAKTFDLSVRHIRDIVSGKRWKHLNAYRK